VPELPDVELFRRRLARNGLHREIERVEVRDRRLVRGVAPDRLRRVLRGRELTSTRRHGKNLLISIDGRWLVEHFGMTGYLERLREADTAPGHTRLLLHFADGSAMAYVDQRRLGSIRLVDDPGDLVAEDGLGPDALTLTESDLGELLDSRRGGIKTALMDQELLAGIGNIYSDEILFQARLHPRTPARELAESERRRLYRQMHRVLETAIARHADPDRMPRGWLLPHRQDGARCPRRNGTIHRLRIGARGAFYCPACQPSRTRRG
jgi:formamidopyrimidine-DNA glycosylase